MPGSLPPAPRKPLRLWPGVTAVALQWLGMFVLPAVAPEQGGMAVIAGMAGTLVVLLWWLFFSRAAWVERLGALLVMAVALAAISPVVHPSISNGMMGFMRFIYGAPLLSLGLVAGAAAGRALSTGRRRAAMAAAMLLACALLTLVRTNGISGDAVSDFEWRWTPTAEERLLAGPAEVPVARPPAPAVETPPEAAVATGEEASAPAEVAGTTVDARAGGGRAARPGRRLARLPRTEPGQRHPRRADRHRLDDVATRRAVATADRTRLVIVCGGRRSLLHPGAAR